MANRKRVKLEIGNNSTNLSNEQKGYLNNYFYGRKRIGGVPAKYTKGMGDRIEIYDMGNNNFVGAIYPDGACMVWPIDWWEMNPNKLIVSRSLPLYSELLFNRKLNKTKKDKRRVILKDTDKKRRVKLNV